MPREPLRLRRDVATILTAHQMDPRRSELYVEGERDKAFLDWLVPLRFRNNAVIVMVKDVEIPGVIEGGNRARLVRFLESVARKPVNIRGFLDADSSRLLETSSALPDNAWVTDFRDLESYVLSEENVVAVIQLGFGKDGSLAPSIYWSMINVARTAAAIRLVSEKMDLKLPVAGHGWLRHTTCDRFGIITANLSKIVNSLMQGANISLTRESEILGAVKETCQGLGVLDDRDVINGKDATALLTRQLQALGIRVLDVSSTLWASFQRDYVDKFANLSTVVEYLRQ